MATRNIVPRADGEGSVGTSAKRWGAVNTNSVITSAINGNNPETLLHPRKNTTAYEAGDVAFAVSAPSSIALVCVTAGITAITEPDFSGVAMGDVVTDGAVKWRCQPIVGGDGVPLGMVAPFLQTSIPDGWLSCENGQEVLRSAYPELWAWVQTNAPLVTEAQWQTKAAAQKSVGYYSSGDGSTTFRLPRLVGFFEGTTAANVGQFTAAGIPNITGSSNVAGYWDYNIPPTGAFQSDTRWGSDFSVSGSADPKSAVIKFNASLDNPIYGASNTVQPESVGMVWCVRAFGAATNQGTVDITELAQMLNLKLSISDAPATCTPFFAPSATYLDLGTQSSGYTYTPPADGYIRLFQMTTTNVNNPTFMSATQGAVSQTTIKTPQTGSSTSLTIPVKKGEVVTTLAENCTFKCIFIYAVGEEP